MLEGPTRRRGESISVGLHRECPLRSLFESGLVSLEPGPSPLPQCADTARLSPPFHPQICNTLPRIAMTKTAAPLRCAHMRSRSKPTGWRYLWAGCLLLSAACQTPEAKHAFGVSAVQFQDVVVPSGFKLRDAGHESYAREEAGWRHAHLVYSGAVKIEEAMGYVRQRMPQHNWTALTEETLPDSGIRLRFERGVYSADYTFSSSREGSTQMVVEYKTDYSRK